MSSVADRPPAGRDPWWRTAAIYQIYLRSFADGDGDGVGDLAGLRDRLPYLAELGVDALWITPWYPSPMVDGGYDVADHRDIDPVFGTLAEAGSLIEEAHALGVRIVIDIVPNHCSDRHPWFQEALAAGPGSPARERFWFHAGDEPPNDWPAAFGGRAWTRVPDGEWYLHLYAPEQPDLNWNHPDVHADFERTLRFWLDRGVDGFRIDVAPALVKAEGLPDLAGYPGHVPWKDQEAVHEIYRTWRAVADSYPGERIFVGEIWLPDQARIARYLRPDELHTAFNFAMLTCAWDAGDLREVIDTTLAEHAKVGAPPTWVLSNHDVPRLVTRYGRADTTFGPHYFSDVHGSPADLELGTRRARAAALLSTALPGGVYVYQGEELGLPGVEDLPAEVLRDPTWVRSGHTVKGRDGSRVPLPWSGPEPPFGFGTGEPWLPQPAGWAAHTVEAQTGDPDSTLALYRAALRARRAVTGDLTWLDTGDVGEVAPDVLAFSRDAGFTCMINLSGDAVPLPPYGSVVLASGPLEGGRLPPDTGVWLIR
ncbi:glycoside hydrolase family 13 protein [Streptosporangium sp. NPDC050855]|uniref:glycoside hydrolase family 13 protein n=1 Tax=Streptosporangium sp. NPDC050855 TaxID=3366194 RepID=UPI0037926188